MEWNLYWTIILQVGVGLVLLALPVYLFTGLITVAILSVKDSVRRNRQPDIRKPNWTL